LILSLKPADECISLCFRHQESMEVIAFLMLQVVDSFGRIHNYDSHGSSFHGIVSFA